MKAVKLSFNFLLLQAPQPVKMYAQNLVEGLLTDTISRAVSEDDNKVDDDKANEETDISLSLATEEPDPIRVSEPSDIPDNSTEPVVKSPSSHVETDSLDESEHAGQHS